MNKEDKEFLMILLFSIIPIIFIYLTLLGFTFLFINKISYTLGYWLYFPLSIFLGIFITYFVVKKANK
jgi:hypothetical protein